MFVARKTAKKIIRNGSYEESLRDVSSLERTCQRYGNILIRYPDVLGETKLRDQVFKSFELTVGVYQKLYMNKERKNLQANDASQTKDETNSETITEQKEEKKRRKKNRTKNLQ